MGALLNAAMLTGLSTVVTLLLGIGRTKLVAISLGAAGVGLLSQVNVALGFASELVTIGFANAVVRGTALAHADSEARRASTLLATAYVVALAITAPIVLIIVVAPQLVEGTIFGNQAPTLALVALAVGIPFLALGSLERAVVQGFKSVRYLAIAATLTSLVGLLFLVPLVLVFGLNGALAHVGVLAVVAYLVFFWARGRVSRQLGLAVSPLVSPSLGAMRTLLSFGSANAIAGVANTATLLLVRTVIVNNLGVEQNGIYQAAWSVPSQILAIIYGTLSSYAFPLISGLRDQNRITEEINLALRFSILITAPTVSLLMLAGGPIITLLYSREFVSATVIMPFQLVGEFLKIGAWSIGLSLLGRKHLVAFTSFDLIWNCIFAGGVFLSISYLGLVGVVLSYAVACLVHVVITYLYQRKREGFRLTPPNVRLLVSSCALVGGAAACAATQHFEYQLAYTVVALLAWTGVGTLPDERRRVWATASRWLRTKIVLPRNV